MRPRTAYLLAGAGGVMLTVSVLGAGILEAPRLALPLQLLVAAETVLMVISSERGWRALHSIAFVMMQATVLLMVPDPDDVVLGGVVGIVLLLVAAWAKRDVEPTSALPALPD